MSEQPPAAGAPLPGPRPAYDELASAEQMAADCRVLQRQLRLTQLERAARAALRPAPSIRYEDYPRELAKRDIEVSEAAARLAAALHLHLD